MSVPVPVGYASFLAFVALQRVCELAYSRRNVARIREEDPHAGVGASDGNPAATGGSSLAAGSSLDWASMIAVHTLVLVLPLLEVSWLHRVAPPPLAWIAYACFALAQALRYWAIASLGRAWNARAVVDPRLGIVSHGPYRWIRHPNYLAVLIEFSAIPLAGGAWISWIVVNVLHAPVLVRRIRAEEALLRRVPGYAERMDDRNRFLPRPFSNRVHRPT